MTPHWTHDFRTALLLTGVIWALGHGVDILFQIAARLWSPADTLREAPLMAAQFALCVALFPVVVWAERTPRRWSWPVLALALAGAGGVLAIGVLLHEIAQGQRPAAILFDLPRLRTWLARSQTVPIYTYIVAFNTSILILVRQMRREAEQRERLLASQAASSRAQLLAMRLQVNPHFVFNALNAISSLVVTERPQAAEELVAQLSEFLRTSLAADPTTTVPLEEEIAVTEAYLAIEALRFGERLAIRIDCPPDCAAFPVPSLILQPLVENVIRHAVGPSVVPVRLHIAAQRTAAGVEVAVRDDAPAGSSTTGPDTPGTGIRNIRERLALIYGPGATIGTHALLPGFEAVLHIPTHPSSSGIQPCAS